MTPFIVGEVSKNWHAGDHLPGDHRTFLCQRFEELILTNLGRGYRLHAFSLNRVVTGPDSLNETIIAVFEAVAPSHGNPSPN